MIGVGVGLGICIGAFYCGVSYFKYKKKPVLSNFITLLLTGTSVHGAFSIGHKLATVDNSKFGIFQNDIIYLWLGAIAIIWVSVSTVFKHFEDLNQTKKP